MAKPANRVASALAGGAVCASQPDTEDLVAAILSLGHLPTQSKRATVEEKRLAVRLIRARKAGSLSSHQEKRLRALES